MIPCPDCAHTETPGFVQLFMSRDVCRTCNGSVVIDDCASEESLADVPPYTTGGDHEMHFPDGTRLRLIKSPGGRSEWGGLTMNFRAEVLDPVSVDESDEVTPLMGLLEMTLKGAAKEPPMDKSFLGIRLNQNEVQEEYAKRLGVSVGALTDTQKKEAFRVISYERAVEASLVADSVASFRAMSDGSLATCWVEPEAREEMARRWLAERGVSTDL